MEHPQHEPTNTIAIASNESKSEKAVIAVKEIMREMIIAELEHPSYDPENCELCRKMGPIKTQTGADNSSVMNV